MNAALYARVSMKFGAQNPEIQLRELREYCNRRGWEVASEHVDIDLSGLKKHRHEFDRLTLECRMRSVDAVVVCRYSRFAKSLRELVNALEEFHALGIAFVSLHEGVDTSTPIGSLVFGIFASIAEFEGELIRERVRSGLAAARAKGKRIGRPRKLLDTAEIDRLRAAGASWRTIATTLGISVGTVHRAAPNRSRTAPGSESVTS